MDLTFGEQVKVILSRRGMTIKELAENIEKETGKKMSRQNLTQRLSRDNFQEQDMRMIAGILGCPFNLNILDEEAQSEAASQKKFEEKEEIPTGELNIQVEEGGLHERDITLGEFVELNESLDQAVQEEAGNEEAVEEPETAAEASEESISVQEPSEESKTAQKETVFLDETDFKDKDKELTPANEAASDSETEGEINPYTGREYENNSVRSHPKRIGYVQVYDRKRHQWTDMTEWAFLGYQERKKVLQGDDYKPPIYLD